MAECTDICGCSSRNSPAFTKPLWSGLDQDCQLVGGLTGLVISLFRARGSDSYPRITKTIGLMPKLPNMVAVWAALVAGLVVLLGDVAPAGAHPAHGSAPGITLAHQSGTPYARSRFSTFLAAIDHRPQVAPLLASVNPEVPIEPANRRSENDCCCSSLLCHAGIPASDAPEPARYLFSERVLPDSSVAVPWRLPSGIERPPR